MTALIRAADAVWRICDNGVVLVDLSDSAALVFRVRSLLALGGYVPKAHRFVLDTWQYFCHRAMHVNKWLYRHIHARHHRLYVPYACGALYNHPVEGFLLDTCGGLVAHWAAGLTTRQDLVLFSISTLKTVDDHSGLALPWDPFQIICGNNADCASLSASSTFCSMMTHRS